jgi:hypothetical protein
LQARTTFGQSRWETCPLRSLSPEIRARQAMNLCASSTSDISSEKKATGRSRLTATFSAMLATKADFPMAGLAATMIRFPGWKPPVIASMSRKPAGVPVISISPVESFSSRSTSSWRISESRRKSLACSLWATSKSSFSARSESSRGSPARSFTHPWISWPAPSNRRSSEFCWTISA